MATTKVFPVVRSCCHFFYPIEYSVFSLEKFGIPDLDSHEPKPNPKMTQSEKRNKKIGWIRPDAGHHFLICGIGDMFPFQQLYSHFFFETTFHIFFSVRESSFNGYKEERKKEKKKNREKSINCRLFSALEVWHKEGLESWTELISEWTGGENRNRISVGWL